MAVVWGSQGTVFGIDVVSGASNAFTVIANITSLSGLGGGTVTAQKTSALSSTVHTYRATIKDPAEVSMDLWYDPTDTTHKFVRNWCDTPTNGPFNCQVIFSTGNTNSSAIFNTVITECDGPHADDVEDNLMASVTLKITGATTWTNSV